MKVENKYLQCVLSLLLVVLLGLPQSVCPFSPTISSSFWSRQQQQHQSPTQNTNNINRNRRRHRHDDIKNLFFSVAVSSSELEKDLTPAERSVTGVVRSCGPAVAYVTSIYPPPTTSSSSRQQQRRGSDGSNNNKDKDSLPEGMSLGTGSGFLVSKEGYVCTNFHVIERAYTINKTLKDIEDSLDKTQQELSKIMTKDLSKSLVSLVKGPLVSENKPPEIYVRIDSATKYQKCSVVEVEPDLDLAVLKIIENGKNSVNPSADSNSNDNNDDDSSSPSGSQLDTVSPISFGSSDNLLVGQSVVAIGNPFGLDKTVTTGVVSAVNREFRAGTARTPNNRLIRNAIQTDASINPGNSGGPLLNLKGEVVGINTAIISTSGSSAGIGFAVPGSRLKPVVDRILLEDRIKDGKRPNSGWLGVSVVKKSPSSATSTMTNSTTTILQNKNWVTSVVPNSPASRESIVPLRILDNGCVEFGDAIVAVAGNDVLTSEQLQKELQDRVTGEQVALTLEDSMATRRVVYVTLEDKPVSDNEEDGNVV